MLGEETRFFASASPSPTADGSPSPLPPPPPSPFMRRMYSRWYSSSFLVPLTLKSSSCLKARRPALEMSLAKSGGYWPVRE